MSAVSSRSESVQDRDPKCRNFISVTSAANKLVGERKSDFLAADLRLLKERQICFRLLDRKSVV